MKFSHCSQIFLLAITFLLVLPGTCLALQPHGAPEGLYVHQMAHILFTCALVYLYLHTGMTTDLVSRGWRYLRLFCLLLILWNIAAFSGHFVALHNARVLGLANPRSPLTLWDYVCFLAGMDHVFNVPALFALMISLRTFYREAREETEK